MMSNTECQLTFDELVDLAIQFRYAVYHAGGMATKSGVEDLLIYRYGISRHLGHDVMNHIEFFDMGNWIRNGWRGDTPEPTMADYPEVKLVGRTGRIQIEKAEVK